MRADSLDIDLIEALHKELAVLSVNNGLHRSSKHLNAVLLQETALVQFDSAVQSSLTAERKKNTLRLFLLDDLLHKMSGDWKEINFVRNALSSLDSSNVRIDKYSLDSLFAKGLQSL